MVRLRACAAVTAFLAAGCGGSSSSTPPAPVHHVSELPAPVISGFDHPSVCDGQRAQVLRISGTGFLTVGGAVPAVTIGAHGSSELGPVVPDGCTTVGTPTYAEGAVEACTGLAVTLPAGVLTAAGSFDVTVLNPGTTAASAPATLAVLAGPTLFHVAPEVAYAGISTALVLSATGTAAPAAGVEVWPHGATTTLASFPADAVAGHPGRERITIPAGQLPAGTYDVALTGANGCPGVLPNAVRVTTAPAVGMGAVTPPFAWTGARTAVTIARAPGPGAFIATPHVFLAPSGGGATAVELASVAYGSADQVTAVVPPGAPAGTYDVIVVNPDGVAGVRLSGLVVTAVRPPAVTSAVPSSIVDAAGQQVRISGTDFRFDAGASATLSCRHGVDEFAPPAILGGATCTAGACSATVTIDGSALPVGAVCLLRIINSDGTFFDHSALGVTAASRDLASTTVGTALVVPRRALVSAAAAARPGARFVYAIGGDGGAGAAGTPYASVEAAAVDPFGAMGAWHVLPAASLGTARAFAASAALGRYLYVFGGTEGTATLATAERAMVLDPIEVPSLAVDDLVLADTGPDAGTWSYRVAAVFSAASLDNPGGESLASDPVVARLPAVAGKKVRVVLAWDAPRDVLGVDLPDVAGYRIYRTPIAGGAAGAEALVATVTAPARTWVDDGAAVPTAGVAALPLGSLGRWAQLPSMNAARQAHGGAAALDPASATSAYVYALLGTDGVAALGSHELLPVTILPNGHQVAASAWKIGASALTPRARLAAIAADGAVASAIAGTYVYVGGGAGSNAVDAGAVASGGALTFSSVTAWAGSRSGYGACAANGQLLAFGGASGAPSQGVLASTIGGSPPALGNWNPSGLTLSAPRYLAGTAGQAPLVVLAGGDGGSGAATATTEVIVW